MRLRSGAQSLDNPVRQVRADAAVGANQQGLAVVVGNRNHLHTAQFGIHEVEACRQRSALVAEFGEHVGGGHQRS